MTISARTADELFEKVSEALKRHKVKNDPNIAAELINANLVLYDPTANTMCECSRKMPLRYALGELAWYNSRNRKASSISEFSSFWEKIADSDGNVNSNYGYCIHDKYSFDQWEYVVNLLKNDPSSRQAVIHIKEPRNTFTKDVNCTMTLQFLLRNGNLDLIVNMRSNDVWLGLPYDVFQFTMMQIQMAMELDVNIGTYYHNDGSLHLYKRNEEAIWQSNTTN